MRYPLHALRQKDVRLPGTIGVGHDADECEPELHIEPIWVWVAAFDRPKCSRQVTVQVDPTQARLTILVVGSDPQRDAAFLTHDVFEVAHERPANTLTAVGCRNNQWMDLPNVTVVTQLRPDPADDPIGVTQRDTTDLLFRHRLDHLPSRGVEILPVVSPATKCVMEQRRCLVDRVRPR